MNSGPLAQGSVRYGLAHLDSVTVGFRGSHGAAVVAAGCSPGGNRVAGEVQRREHQAARLHRDAGDVGGRGGVGRDALRRAARVWPQWGTGYELSVIAAVILVGTGIGLGSVIGSLFGSLLIGMINNGLILAGLDASQQQMMVGLIIVVAVALARRK